MIYNMVNHLLNINVCKYIAVLILAVIIFEVCLRMFQYFIKNDTHGKNMLCFQPDHIEWLFYISS